MSDTLVCRDLIEEVSHRDKRQTEVCRTSVSVTSRCTEARAIFWRQNKRPYHLRLEGITIVEVQLPEPEVEAWRVRITSQVADVFHVDKHPTVLLIVEGLSV